ncbi:MAG: hypothetical protein FWE16_04425 [Firmicutes bacterium]|nr:hypothetical protein [Bacillota bacterium]
MKTIWTLIKLQFKARVALKKQPSLQKKIKFGIIVASLFALFGLFVFVYWLLANQFVSDNPLLDLRREFLIFTILGFQVLQTVFLIPNMVKSLDINNERELLLKLPITHKQIFASKMITGYLGEILFATIIMLPILIAYGLASSMSWGFYLFVPIILIFLPAIPFFISSLVLYPVTKAVQFMKSRALLTSVSYLVGLVVAIYLYMQAIHTVMAGIMDSGNFRLQLEDNIYRIREVGRMFFPQGLFANMGSGEPLTILWSFFVLIGICGALLAISYFIAGANYKKTYMNETSGGYRSISRSHVSNPRSPLYATFKKDTLNILRSSNYTFQLLLMVVITPMLVFFVNRIAFFSSYQEFRNMGELDQAGGIAFGVSLFVLLILLPLVSSFAASNITREGPNIYHTKIIPQSYIRQLFVKIVIVMIPIILAVVASVLMLRIPFQPDILAPPQYLHGWDVWYLLLVGLFMAVGYVCIGTYFDLRNPLCNQLGDGELVKPTKHVNNIMGIGIVIGAVVGILAMIGGFADLLTFAPQWIRTIAIMGEHIKTVFFVFAGIFAVVSVLLLAIDGVRQYKKLEQ